MTDSNQLLGEIKVLAEKTHEDVVAIRSRLDRQHDEMTDMRMVIQTHKVWFKVLAGVLTTLVVGTGGFASFLSIFAR